MYDKIIKNDKEVNAPTVIFVHDFNDVDKIITVLEIKKDVIVNTSNIDNTSKVRIIDFLSGYIFAKNGNKEKYEKNIYLFHY